MVADVDGGQCLALPNEVVRRSLQFPARSMNPDLALAEAKQRGRRWLREQFAGPQPIAIASHEALSFARTGREVRRLRRILRGRTVTIVLVLREREAFLTSWASQLESMGFSSQSEYRSSVMYVEPDSWLGDSAALVSAYRGVFGHRAVTVLRYEEMVERDGSATPALWQACGLPNVGAEQSLAAWTNVTAERPGPPPPSQSSRNASL